ncbi:MAG: cysteine hydrolase family protein [Pyrinomonadaceae bacterium]
MGKNKQAVLIVDMINDFQHEDGDQLFRQVLPIARSIKVLKERANKAGVPVIYVNDNFEHWHDTFQSTIKHVEQNSEEGRQLVELLRPGRDDYYVLKPHRSGFYKTPLGVLLDELDVDELIITGSTTDMCVLSTAHDAQMRKYKIRVPRDCTTGIKNEYRDQALDLMERVLDANISPSSEIEFM